MKTENVTFYRGITTLGKKLAINKKPTFSLFCLRTNDLRVVQYFLWFRHKLGTRSGDRRETVIEEGGRSVRNGGTDQERVPEVRVTVRTVSRNWVTGEVEDEYELEKGSG